MILRRLLVTGASGFVGRHLLDAIKDEFVVFGLARRTPQQSGAPVHPNIHWLQADIENRISVANAFQEIQGAGGVDAVIHLAAYYDFTGDPHPGYWRTNVDGLRNVLDACRDTNLRRFIFSSSVAACRFPAPGKYVDETSPPDGIEIYSRSKAIAEAMIAGYRDSMKPIVVRFGALFSDWCEYPPLFMLSRAWMSHRWDSRIVPGRGRTALPFLHVREVAPFMRILLDKFELLDPCEVLVMSSDGATDHRAIYDALTTQYFGRSPRPILVPKAVCGPAMRVRDLLGRTIGRRPFERGWMARYIDGVLRVDASRTRHRLHWQPRERMELLRRIPFIVENFRLDPVEWSRRNQRRMHRPLVADNLGVHALLERHHGEIAGRLTSLMLSDGARARFPTYHDRPRDTQEWDQTVVLRQLSNAVRTLDPGVFFSFCEDLASRRFRQGFPARELCDALGAVEDAVIEVLAEDPASAGLKPALDRLVKMNVRGGIDRVLDVYDAFEASGKRPGAVAK